MTHNGLDNIYDYTNGMSMATTSVPKRQTAPAFKRCIWLVCASILLHWLIIEWGVDAVHLEEQVKDQVPVIETRLLPPPPLLSPPRLIKPIKTSKRTPASAATKTTAAHESVLGQVSNKHAARTITAADIAAARASVAELLPPSMVTPKQQQEAANNAPYKIKLPPSAELEYNVQKTSQNGEPLYGHGTIKWQTDGQRYVIDGDAGVLFFTVLTFKSEGRIDDQGIAPNIYQEKRFRKTETNTYFRPEHNSIDFSSNGTSIPRVGIEQDRISVIWQLAGIGRGGNSFSAGDEIDMLVAGTRKVSLWRMQIVGEEKITINDEAISTWHITRIPENNAHDQKLDIWLAPQKNWYPVRLRYTEDNNDYLDMSINKLNVLNQQ